jgi:alpha-ketoglutarate-dependent taurine dioxygenase
VVTATKPMNSIIEVTAGDEADWWTRERDAIRALLVEHFGAELAGAKLPESPDPSTLRSRLREVAPRLAAFTDRVRAAFDSDGACAVLIPSVGLAGVEVDERRKGMYAFSALLGDVMANHPKEHVVWDVKSKDKPLKPGQHRSHSRGSAGAGYHTDAGYLKVPPRFFLLYAAQQARCGGGRSMIRDGRLLRNRLEETEKGRAAIKALSQTLPRNVPEQFQYVGYVAEDGWQYSQVLGEARPMWRWGKKNSTVAIEANPEYATPEVWEALDTVADLLDNGPDEFRPMVPTDGCIVVENHIALHGRTSFTDQGRHLFRIRFHDPAETER